jgi:IS4 transposase
VTAIVEGRILLQRLLRLRLRLRLRRCGQPRQSLLLLQTCLLLTCLLLLLLLLLLMACQQLSLCQLPPSW